DRHRVSLPLRRRLGGAGRHRQTQQGTRRHIVGPRAARAAQRSAPRPFDEVQKAHVRPGVVEPAAGLTRAALTFLIDAYEEQLIDPAKNDQRTVLHLHPALAPYKACVLPLYKKPDLVRAARGVYEDLRRRWLITYDSGSNIGK